MLSFRTSSPLLQPALLGALLVVAGMTGACADDPKTAGSGGQSSSAAGAAVAGATNPGTGGAGPSTAGAPATGGTVGTAGSAPNAGAAPVAGSGGSNPGTAGSSNVAGASGSGTGTAGGGSGGAGSTHWVGTWTASPYTTAAADAPTQSLANSVLRQITHVSLGGSQIRVQFSNLRGDGPVTIKSAHVALCKATPKVDSTIDTTTDKALSFSSMASVTIAAGAEIWSDALDFTMPALSNVTITTAFGNVPAALTSHAGARTNSYVVSNSTDVSAASMSAGTKYIHWYFISGIDVMAPTAAKGIVAIGDSITDGRGTTDDQNNRWTDYLAARLQANAATANVSLMNQGIGATSLAGTDPKSAESRFVRDVLGQSGVKYAIVLDGVNDIGGSNSNTLAAMKAAYDKMIKAAHDKGVLIYGGTITPFGSNTGTNGYYTPEHETLRLQVNTYIKSGVFDGVIDFDAAVTDGGTVPSLSAATMSADGLHPGPPGYKTMSDKVDLSFFAR